MKKLNLIITFLFICILSSAAELYKTNVTASYYADKFHGRKTANGEIFNMYAMTAAHKTLPFNTVLKVTNLSNGKSVQVRVNDRGPFVKGREIDLSKGAASKLGMIKTGTAKVRLEIVSSLSAKKAAAPATSPKNTAPNKSYIIQLGAFSNQANASKRAQALQKAGFSNVVLLKSGTVTRVCINNVSSANLQTTLSKLQSKGYKDYLVKEK